MSKLPNLKVIAHFGVGYDTVDVEAARKRGIAVTTICPGFVESALTENSPYKLPLLMSAENAAKRIVKGLRRRVKVLNFPWQTTLMVKCLRWLPEWFVARQMRGRYGDPNLAAKDMRRAEV